MFLENRELDKNIPIPLYYQLKEMILEDIKSGQYPVDSLIPTEKEISEKFNISRTTVRQAITELVQEGWLYRIKSKGTFIARQKIQQDFLQRLETYPEQIRRIGMEPSTEVLELKAMAAPKTVAEELEISEGEKVIYLFRRRFGDNEPVVTVETYLSYDQCKFLMDVDLEKNSLYDVLSTREDTRIYSARRIVEAVEATKRDVQYLNVRKGSPIQMTYSVGLNRDQKPVEYSVARYRGDMSSFRVIVHVEKE